MRDFYYGPLTVEISNPCYICSSSGIILKPKVKGGNTPYTYLWNTGQTTESIKGIPESFSQNSEGFTSSSAIQSEQSNSIRFYPNPFNQGIYVRLDSRLQDDVHLKVIGVLGNTVFERKWKVSAGLNEIYLREFEPLPGGLYTVWVKNSKGENAYRLVKIE